jgi:hypothetical protein
MLARAFFGEPVACLLAHALTGDLDVTIIFSCMVFVVTNRKHHHVSIIVQLAR